MLIKAEFDESDGTYGYRRIAAILRRKGTIVCPGHGLVDHARPGPRCTARTEKSAPLCPPGDLDDRPDLVKRDFSTPLPLA